MIDRTATPRIPRHRAPRSGASSTPRWTRSARPTASRTSRSRPGTDTIEPSDVDLAQVVLRDRPRHPDPRVRDGRRRRRPDGRRARRGSAASPILNLEGVQARYDDPDAVLERIAAAPDDDVQGLLAEVYQQPIREELIARRLDEIHAAGSQAAVAATPGAARRFGPFCAEHGADLFLVQSQVSSAPATWRPSTTRCRSPTSPATCRSRSRSATRPTPRRPSR